ncbi:hypothetical protein ABK040_005187 [Willaertia magna]
MSSRLPPLPSLREILKLYGLQASKELSQNFLLNLHVTDRIIKHCDNIENKTVIEIGPGPGSLTRSILQKNPKRLIVVEKDDRFLPALQNLQQSVPDGKMHIVQGDILKIDQLDLIDYFLTEEEKENLQRKRENLLQNVTKEILEKRENFQQFIETTISEQLKNNNLLNNNTLQNNNLPNNLINIEKQKYHFLQSQIKIENDENNISDIVFVGNLPFGISTPLLLNWLRDCTNHKGAFHFHHRIPMILMFQKEFGDRMSASPSMKEYSRLSVSTQAICNVENLFTVKAKSFVPPPNVDAAVVKLIPRIIPTIDTSIVSFEDLEQFCKVIFNSRRKQLLTNLSVFLNNKQAQYIVAGIVEDGMNNLGLVNQVLTKRSQDFTVEEISIMTRRFVRLREKNLELKEILNKKIKL